MHTFPGFYIMYVQVNTVQKPDFTFTLNLGPTWNLTFVLPQITIRPWSYHLATLGLWFLVLTQCPLSIRTI